MGSSTSQRLLVGTEQLPRVNDVPEHLLKALARAFRGAQIRAA
jgi:hypothetical protein